MQLDEELEQIRGALRYMRDRQGDAGWLKTPAISGFLKGVRSKEDPSYQRPIQGTTVEQRW
jgi:hypothetical protein